MSAPSPAVPRAIFAAVAHSSSSASSAHSARGQKRKQLSSVKVEAETVERALALAEIEAQPVATTNPLLQYAKLRFTCVKTGIATTEKAIDTLIYGNLGLTNRGIICLYAHHKYALVAKVSILTKLFLANPEQPTNVTLEKRIIHLELPGNTGKNSLVFQMGKNQWQSDVFEIRKYAVNRCSHIFHIAAESWLKGLKLPEKEFTNLLKRLESAKQKIIKNEEHHKEYRIRNFNSRQNKKARLHASTASSNTAVASRNMSLQPTILPEHTPIISPLSASSTSPLQGRKPPQDVKMSDPSLSSSASAASTAVTVSGQLYRLEEEKNTLENRIVQIQRNIKRLQDEKRQILKALQRINTRCNTVHMPSVRHRDILPSSGSARSSSSAVAFSSGSAETESQPVATTNPLLQYAPLRFTRVTTGAATTEKAIDTLIYGNIGLTNRGIICLYASHKYVFITEGTIVTNLFLSKLKEYLSEQPTDITLEERIIHLKLPGSTGANSLVFQMGKDQWQSEVFEIRQYSVHQYSHIFHIAAESWLEGLKLPETEFTNLLTCLESAKQNIIKNEKSHKNQTLRNKSRKNKKACLQASIAFPNAAVASKNVLPAAVISCTAAPAIVRSLIPTPRYASANMPLQPTILPEPIISPESAFSPLSVSATSPATPLYNTQDVMMNDSFLI